MNQQDIEALEIVTQNVAQIVGPVFKGLGAGFCVIGFTFGEDGWSTYVSNATRGDMVKALRELADTLEMELDVPPLHGKAQVMVKKGGTAS